MYLHETMEDMEGRKFAGVGAVEGSAYYTGKLTRFGYIGLKANREGILGSGCTALKGHEFHYFDSEKNGEDCIAIKPVTGRTYPCVIEKENVWMGFPHLYYPSNPSFADHFVKKAEQYLGGKYGEFLSFF